MHFNPNLFQEASKILSSLSEPFTRIPILDLDGNYINIIEDTPSLYRHIYTYQGKIDTSILQLYNCICLHEVNEFSFEICLHCLDTWSGTLILCGKDWTDFQNILPDFSGHIQLLLDSQLSPEEFRYITEQSNTIHIHYFASNMPGYQERIQKGIFSYDEIMTLLFCFSQEHHLGAKNPDKKFYIVDGTFSFQGLFAMRDKLFAGASYVHSKGYIPLFHIVSSDYSIYSDYPGEDIWDKFFIQPEGYLLEDVCGSSSVTYSPNFNLTMPCMHFMNLFSQNINEAQYDNSLHNLLKPKIIQYIPELASAILPYPQKTLGVLIRGTDYIKTKPSGHAVQADVETVIKKIYELRKSWYPYPYIFVHRRCRYLRTDGARIQRTPVIHRSGTFSFGRRPVFMSVKTRTETRWLSERH